MDRSELRQVYRRVRAATRALAEPLSVEDQMVQSMPDASPTKWHLAHTTWFFETFVLARVATAHRPADARWAVLFNSYYDGVGEQFARARRGQLSRPALGEVLAWRDRVDASIDRLLETAAEADLEPLLFTIELGINHEEQHQELILTDLKHALHQSTLDGAYASPRRPAPAPGTSLGWKTFDGGLRWVGHGGQTFAFDNERPRYRAHLEPFSLTNRVVTAGEYSEFVRDGGYRTKSLWLAEGWEAKQAQGWDAPLYWRDEGGGWSLFTLAGRRPLEPHEPVCHVSFYEADAFATWAGARVPVEHEVEVAALELGARPRDGNFVESAMLHPRATRAAADGVDQLLGDVWEWTGSAYRPYPGFAPFEGALGEYNGKFMVNQMVLRGGSCLSPVRHLRPTYRNFFPPTARWQMTGVRLARSV